MRNYMFYLAALVFVFTSCEKEAMEPEMINANFQVEENAQKAHLKKVQSFRAHLTGDEEVPPVETNATGQTIFKLSKDGNTLYYKLIVANIMNVRAAHIHLGEMGVNGGVLVTLYGGGLIPGRTSGVLAEGMITSDMVSGYTLAQLLDLMAEEKTYVNVHTNQYPGGEIRGQITANN